MHVAVDQPGEQCVTRQVDDAYTTRPACRRFDGYDFTCVHPNHRIRNEISVSINGEIGDNCNLSLLAHHESRCGEGENHHEVSGPTHLLSPERDRHR